MASFKDSIPQFTPYIQQLPVEDMVKVGMYKQQLYDQGVQKIQSQIDSIAGLDITHDADKKYLESKLNELGNNLKTVAAGDFSNFQLVNSVSGMTSQIVKDKNIQNAVASTMNDRRQVQLMTKAQEEGKSNPNNDFDYMLKRNKWLSSDQVGQAFNDKYVPYKDVTGKLSDIATKIMAQSKSSTSDNPYISDAGGNTLYFDKKGNASLDSTKGTAIKADVMKRIEVSGVSADKLYNVFKDFLDGGDLEQLRINAQGEWYNKPIDFYKETINNTYAETKKQIDDAIVQYTAELGSGNLSPERKLELQSDLAKLQAKVKDGGLDKEKEDLLNSLDTPDGLSRYRTNVYTDTYLRNLAKDINNRALSVKVESSPYFQAEMEKKKYILEVNKAVNDQAYKQATLSIAMQRLDIERARLVMDQQDKADKKYKEEHKNDAVTSIAPTSPEVMIPTATELADNIKVSMNDLNKTKLEIGKKLATDPKTPPSQLIKIGEAWLNNYNVDPTSINGKGSAFIELVKKASAIEDNIYVQGNILKTAQKAGGQYDKNIRNELKKHNSLRVGSTVYSPEDVLVFTDSLKKMVPDALVVSQAGFGFNSGANINLTKEQVDKFKNTKFYNLAKSLSENNTKALGLYNTDAKALVLGYIKGINNTVNIKLSNDVKGKLEAERKVIGNASPDFMKMRYSFSNNNTSDFDTIDKVISSAIGQYNDTKELIGAGALDTNALKDFSPDAAQALVGDKKRVVNLYRNFDNSGYLAISGKDSNGVIRIPLSSREMSSWFPKYTTSNPMSLIKTQASFGNKTTNKLGTVNPVSAGINGYSDLLPNLNKSDLAHAVRFDVIGSQDNNGSAYDKFDIMVYYNDPKKGWQSKVVNQGGFLYEDSVLTALQSIGPNTIRDLFKK